MKPKKPYLLRAVHEWIVDNGLTPHIMVDATQLDVHVVEEYIQNGRIVLNIDTDAIDNLHLDDESVSFTRLLWFRQSSLSNICSYARDFGHFCTKKSPMVASF